MGEAHGEGKRAGKAGKVWAAVKEAAAVKVGAVRMVVVAMVAAAAVAVVAARSLTARVEAFEKAGMEAIGALTMAGLMVGPSVAAGPQRGGRNRHS